MLAALNIACRLLKPGGVFVAKIFRGRDTDLLFKQFLQYFGEAYCAKPKSCRNSSIESFIVAKGFKGFSSQNKELSNHELVGQLNYLQTQSYFATSDDMDDDSLTTAVKFVACGYDSELDADMNYSLDQAVTSTGGYKYVKPRQMPINPPYVEYFKRKQK